MRLTEWVRRYGVAEIAGVCAAAVAALAALALTGSELLAAYAGVLGESAGFYGTMIARHLIIDDRGADSPRRSWAPRDVYRAAAKLLFEFGPAEVADGVIRPLAVSVGVQVLGFQWGLFAGKLVADLLFYTQVVSAYELRRYLSQAHAEG